MQNQAQPILAQQHSAGRPGFTLLEVMISAGILAVVLSAAYLFMASFDRASRYNVKYYELYQQIQDDQIDLDRLLTSGYQVEITAGADQVSGADRTVTFYVISGFEKDGVTPIAAKRTLSWTKTKVVSEEDFKFDCDGNGSALDKLNVGKLMIDGVQKGDEDVIEPIITLDEATSVIKIVLKRINSQGFVAKRTLEATYNPSSEIISTSTF